MTRESISIWELAARHGWQYSGDSNLEFGGTFYRFPESGPWPVSDFAESVEVIDLESAIGAPSGAFWISRGSVYMPAPGDSFHAANRRSALAACGYSLESYDPESGAVVLLGGALGRVTGFDAARLAFDAFAAYWGAESPDVFSVAKGAACRDEWRDSDGMGRTPEPNPDFVLRSNANFPAFVAREFL